VTDHGLLSGLADDDHSQYFNTTRGDARYLQISSFSEHDIIDYHTADGAQYDIVGLTATDTLGLLTPASDISGGNTILISDSNGDATLSALTANGSDVAITSGALRWDSTNGALWLNNGDPTSTAGAMLVRSAVAGQIGLQIKQRSDQSGDLMTVNDSSNAQLWYVNNDGNIQSGAWQDKVTGWQATPGGKFTAWNANIRGTIYATVFQVDEVHASSGELIVTPSNGVMLENVVCNGEGTSIVLKIEDRPNTSAPMFRVDDVLYCFTLGIEPTTDVSLSSNFWDVDAAANEATLITAEAWFTVTSRAYSTDHWEYTCDVEKGVQFTLRDGTGIINYGQRLPSGDPGHISISAISGAHYDDGDPQQGSPKITVRTMGSDTPWNDGFTEHVIVGEIADVKTMFPDTQLSKSGYWGIAFSEDFSDSSKPHAVLSNQGTGMRNINMQFQQSDGEGGYNTTGVIYSNGSLSFSPDIDTFEFGLYFNTETESLMIGDPSGDRVQWLPDTNQLAILSGPLATESSNPQTNTPGLYLSANRLGHWTGTEWATSIDSGGNFSFIYAPTDPDETRTPGTGLFWDASSGRLNGMGENADSTVSEQFYIDATDGRFYAGGGHVTLDEDGISLLESSSATSWQDNERISFGDDMSILGWFVSNDKVLRIASTPGYATTNSYDADVRLIAAGGTASSPNEAEIRVESRNDSSPSNFYINTDQIEVSMVLPTSAGSSSGKYLPIVRGGITYKIALLDDS